MFAQIVLHRALDRGKIDQGLIAETLLFYRDVLLLLDRGSLTELVKTFKADDILRLVEEFGLKLSYHCEQFGTYSVVENGLPRNQFVSFQAGGNGKKKKISVREEMQDVLSLGTDRQQRRFAQKLIDVTAANRMTDTDIENLRRAATDYIRDNAFAQFAAEATIINLFPSMGIDPGWKFAVMDVGDGFVFDTNIDFSRLTAEYQKLPSQANGSVTAAYLASSIVSSRVDAFYASSYMSGYVSNPISSALIKRRFLDLIRRRERDAREIDLFQEKVLRDAKKIREVINSGEVSFSDMFPVLTNAGKFKKWLDRGNPDESLISQYYDEVTRPIWIQGLKGKTLRWTVTAGLGIVAGMTFSPALGALASLGLGYIDTFLLDRVLHGWRPDQFVEGPLSDIIAGRA